MSQVAEQNETRASAAMLSDASQLIDDIQSSSGDMGLTVAPINAHPADDSNQTDVAITLKNPDDDTLAFVASAPNVNVPGDDLNAALLSPVLLATDETPTEGFHFSTAPDAFWFSADGTEHAEIFSAHSEISADDQGNLFVEGTSGHWGSGELAYTTKLASLFHDNGAGDGVGGFDRAVSDGVELSHQPATDGVPLPPAATDGDFLLSAPNPAVPESERPIPNWIIQSSGAGGGSGSLGGVTTTNSVVNQASSGLVINVIYDPSVANAPTGFTADVQSVVNYFESHFSNPITITIDVGYGEVHGYSLGSALGESITYFDRVSYSQLQNALVTNLNAIGDTAAAASLPTTSPVSGQWWVSTAEAGALGLTSASNNPDGYVGFSSASNIFAYNDSNGVPSGQYDFTAVVAHEISEVMGRQMFDGTNVFGTGASYDPLDLFHYSAPGVRDFTGFTGYASADGGKTSLDAFNAIRGGDLGDWASSAGNDAFNAFAKPGVVNSVTQSDLTELNLLGWKPASSASPPPTAPAVTISLAQDTGVSATDKITLNDALTGTADPNAVVKIMTGSTVLGSTTASASGVWSFAPVGLADSSYALTASETNAAGLTGSAALNFTLDTTAPVVTSDIVSGSGISGGAGILTAGQLAVFTLALTEPIVISGGTPALALNDDGAAVYDPSHSTSTSLVFDYTVAAGQFTSTLAVTGVNLNGATVTDIAGNSANLTGADISFPALSVDATTPVDTTTPNVVQAHAHDILSSSVSASASNGVLVGDSDANPSDVLSVSAVLGSAGNVGQPVAGAFGQLTLNADGSYTYNNTNPSAVTAAGGVTEDQFNYTVSNGHGGTADATLSVLITNPNDTYLTGSAGGTLQGGAGNYVLDGSAGNMNLTAGTQGQQWLVGGSGDVLNAGPSADTFMFSPGFGKETINNFNPNQDVIDLPQSLFPSLTALHGDIHTSGTDTLIVLDANDIITLSHVAVTSLHAQNFHFLV
jgi:VCBS repeat-containing protein